MSSKLLLVVLLIICIVAHFDGVNGACSEEHQHTEVQKCEKAFVDAMAKNANVNCSVELNKVHNCLTTLSKECYPKVNEKMIKQLVTIAMKQFQAMEFYCSKSNNITATWSNIAPAIRDRLPCYARAITNETSYKCSKGFRTDLHKTPKDSEAIYRSYDESNKCMKKETARYCTTAPSHAAVINMHTAMFGLLVMLTLSIHV